MHRMAQLWKSGAIAGIVAVLASIGGLVLYGRAWNHRIQMVSRTDDFREMYLQLLRPDPEVLEVVRVGFILGFILSLVGVGASSVALFQIDVRGGSRAGAIVRLAAAIVGLAMGILGVVLCGLSLPVVSLSH